MAQINVKQAKNDEPVVNGVCDDFEKRMLQFDNTLKGYLNSIPFDVYYAKDEDTMKRIHDVKKAMVDEKLSKRSKLKKNIKAKKTLNRFAKLDPRLNEALQPVSIREGFDKLHLKNMPADKKANQKSPMPSKAKQKLSSKVTSDTTRPDKASDDQPGGLSKRLKKKLKKFGLSYDNGDAINDLRARLDAKMKEIKRNKEVENGMSNGHPGKSSSQKPPANQRGQRQGSIESLTSSSSNASKVQDANGNMVFSKFDFVKPPAVTTTKEDDEKRRRLKPKLQRLNDELRKATFKKNKIEKIAETNPEMGAKLKAKDGWRHALEKVEGIKVKDDPTMINKAIKKIKHIKKKKAEKWAERNRHVEEQMAKRQKERNANIKKRIQAKKESKIKKMKKKGRVIPGF